MPTLRPARGTDVATIAIIWHDGWPYGHVGSVPEYVFVVNTHLEVSGAPCLTDAGLVSCQDVQAAELHDVLAEESLPVVLVGDINAEVGETAYETFASGGYLDTWTVRYPYNESGVTCCQSETLDNVANELSKRIDHIFISNNAQLRFAITTVVGDWEQRKTPTGLWYSDHGGPWARLYITF